MPARSRKTRKSNRSRRNHRPLVAETLERRELLTTFDFTGPYVMDNWSSTGIDDGDTSITPDSGASTSADFFYNVTLPQGGVSPRSVDFLVDSSVTGSVNFDFEYTGNHFYYLPDVQFETLGVNTNSVVDSSPVSAFTFNGSASFIAEQGQPMGFRIGGSNFDAISQIVGNLNITNFVVHDSLVVDSLVDVDDGDYSQGNFSLREALNLANSIPGEDRITFDSSLHGESIVLQSQLPTISRSVSIIGPGADMLTIDAGPSLSLRHFDIDDSTDLLIDVAISGVTLTNGNGSIRNLESLLLQKVSIEGNASSFGGAITNGNRAELKIESSTLSNNSATSNGGAIDNAGQLEIVNSTLSGNQAGVNGGAIINYGTGSSIAIRSSTIHNNTASNLNSGPSIANWSTATIENSIVSDPIRQETGSLTGNYNLFATTGPTTGGASDARTANPMLGQLARNGGPTRTHSLLAGSPAINAGNSGTMPPSSDQRGIPFLRDDGNGIDIGAYEQQSLDPTLFRVTTTNDEFDFNNSDVSLREAIALANGNAGQETITFDDSLNGQSILLDSQLPTITGDMTIFGLGADLLSIDAQGGGDNQLDGDGFRIFDIDDGMPGLISVEISGLTLTGGDHPNIGGAILNVENLTLKNMSIEGNRSGFGGGIIGRPTSQTMIFDSTIS
ncbi:MAG: CSLREA domain-containing protein, partial [Planctomycetota bacterium]